ncbi:hypothetical protein ACJO2E_18165 [Marinobacter sp. M1N3S26]|uniref:hypothetical protein n=1 Tax=Marinobacter sp. M1N3S26 TaxID=3382299 RepID=UPI00387AEC18
MQASLELDYLLYTTLHGSCHLFLTRMGPGLMRALFLFLADKRSMMLFFATFYGAGILRMHPRGAQKAGGELSE